MSSETTGYSKKSKIGSKIYSEGTSHTQKLPKKKAEEAGILSSHTPQPSTYLPAQSDGMSDRKQLN